MYKPLRPETLYKLAEHLTETVEKIEDLENQENRFSKQGAKDLALTLESLAGLLEQCPEDEKYIPDDYLNKVKEIVKRYKESEKVTNYVKELSMSGEFLYLYKQTERIYNQVIEESR